MSASRDPSGPRQLVIRRPLAGVIVGRSAGGPLVRAIPERYGTTLHLAGRSEWQSGRARWSSTPATISVKVPGEVAVELARLGRPEAQTVLFDAALVDDARAALGRPTALPRTTAVDDGDPRARPLAALHRQLLDGDDSGLEEAVCLAVAAFVDVTSAARGTAFRASDFSAAVARTRALLDARLTVTLTLDELSAHARLDKFQLCRAFREQVGLPPHAYVTHRRVALAQALLASGVPPAEVAARVGLYDQSLLHRHFKRIVGVTPGAFARAAR